MTAKHRTPQKATQTKSLMRTPIVIVILLAGIAIVSLLYLSRPQSTGSAVQFQHIHGLGFSADGQQLFVPAHNGFLIFRNGRWEVPDLPVHDYMGYSAADDGFYSSGHPGPGSNLINPLGLIRSTDGGQTFTTLDFEGETDFHLMSVGYRNHAIYVVNPSPNSRLSAGLHYSLDDGQNWEQSAGQGISGSPIQIAVHPTDAQTVALAAEGGLFLSNDYGDTFTRIGDTMPVSTATFDPDGDRLLFGYQSLFAYDMATGQTTSFPSPAVTGNDAISNVAVNTQSDQIALATFNRNIYLSQDDGQEWEQIAVEGNGRG
jgi:hypothetical protein